MSKHTPGPWMIRYEHYPFPNQYRIGQQNGDNYTALVVGEDNANLVAAAPELLKALEALVDSVPKQTPDQDWWPDDLNAAMKAAQKLLDKL